ncbi:MAG TPA: TraR/DksA C4-type zinc finger protein [Ferruginibacter sp.]|nr:TraR/DksA C4-type zinc finger protein [Ferruginibacter sp.]HMP19328.1 TraR/DksA C4-type zinc finger protein [Ferruginibacter sp.]
MATKKQGPVKNGKAAAKPAAKKAAKPSKPAAKKATKPVAKKAAKPVAKKQPVKKAAVKPAPKKAVKPAKTVKKESKPVAKKAPVKKAVQPAPAKAATKSAVSVKTTNNHMAKKEISKPAVKAPAAKPAAEVKAKDIKVQTPKPVVLPKITTKTARKYEPDFTKSVLDKAAVDPGAPSQRYSDPELAEFKELILRKLEAAKKELTYLQGLITRKDEMGGDEGDNRYMTMEDGSLSMEREQLSQMASRQITFIDHLEKALMRIENKTYGICRVTGKLIDKARLRAVPHATLSIEAKMGTVK